MKLNRVVRPADNGPFVGRTGQETKLRGAGGTVRLKQVTHHQAMTCQHHISAGGQGGRLAWRQRLVGLHGFEQVPFIGAVLATAIVV